MLTLLKAPDVLQQGDLEIGQPRDYNANLALNEFPDLDITIPAQQETD